jgi:hypothetical protein
MRAHLASTALFVLTVALFAGASLYSRMSSSSMRLLQAQRPHLPANPREIPVGYSPRALNKRISNSPEPDLCRLDDALASAKLDPLRILYTCSACHAQIHSALSAANGGGCVACGSPNVRPVSELSVSRTRDRSASRIFSPHEVGLTNFRSYFGRVVGFEGRVDGDCK